MDSAIKNGSEEVSFAPPLGTPMDLSDRYVRMCAAAEAMQSWWHKAPWVDPNANPTEEFFLKDLKPIRSNIKVGDFIHHGKDPSRRANVPQQVSIISNRTVHAERQFSYFLYEYSWDIGGHYPLLPHYQLGDPRLQENRTPVDYFVWLPRLDQLVKYDGLGPTMRPGPHWCLSEFLRFLKGIRQVMWIETAEGEKEIVARTLEQAALMTHMWRAYHKVWVEESGEWIQRGELLKPGSIKVETVAGTPVDSKLLPSRPYADKFYTEATACDHCSHEFCGDCSLHHHHSTWQMTCCQCKKFTNRIVEKETGDDGS